MKKFIFEDGTVVICKGMSKHEKAVEVRKHGKLVWEGRYIG